MKSSNLFFRILSLAVICASLLSQRANALTTNVVASGSFPNFVFTPKILSINAGDTVVWTGLSGIHSVTGDTPPETMCGTQFPPACTNSFNTPGAYIYHCINHGGFGMTGLVNVASVAVPLTVSIANPANGSVFAAPATIKLTANPAGAAVTNIEFFSAGDSIGSVVAAPFTLNTSPLAAGPYMFTAIAHANTGLSATSAPVNVTVVAPVAVLLSNPQVTNGQFTFQHTADAGLRYVVENTPDFTNWSAVTTNLATSNTVNASDTFQVGSFRFYRVGRLPNP